MDEDVPANTSPRDVSTAVYARLVSSLAYDVFNIIAAIATILSNRSQRHIRSALERPTCYSNAGVPPATHVAKFL
jgi:hypothetical protein